MLCYNYLIKGKYKLYFSGEMIFYFNVMLLKKDIDK